MIYSKAYSKMYWTQPLAVPPPPSLVFCTGRHGGSTRNGRTRGLHLSGPRLLLHQSVRCSTSLPAIVHPPPQQTSTSEFLPSYRHGPFPFSIVQCSAILLIWSKTTD